MENRRPGKCRVGIVFLIAWAVFASLAAAACLRTAREAAADNARLEEEILRRDRTDFLVELDACAQDLLATRRLLSDRLDWMAQHHLAELRRFGQALRSGPSEGFDFLDVHEREVWAHEAERINEELSRRGVPPLRPR